MKHLIILEEIAPRAIAAAIILEDFAFRDARNFRILKEFAPRAIAAVIILEEFAPRETKNIIFLEEFLCRSQNTKIRPFTAAGVREALKRYNSREIRPGR